MNTTGHPDGMQFSMKVAGHTAHVTAQFTSTPHYFRDYWTADTPEFSIAVTQADMDYEQAFSLEEARQEGIRPRLYSGAHLERAAILRAFTRFLIHRNILLLHGSTVAMDGKAYLFTARCGTGKSTHTRLWCQMFGERACMVNDDKPFLLLQDTGVIAFGSPWNGKHGLSTNIAVPLQGICILRRGPENRIRSLSPEEALPHLLQQLCPPTEPELATKAWLLLQALTQKVSLWQMECTPTPEAAVTAYHAMRPL